MVKTSIILGLALAGAVASESLLRTDDFDTLVYQTDAPVTAAPTDSNCGKYDATTKVAANADDCLKNGSDPKVRCCAITVTTGAEGAKTNSIFCQSTSKNWYVKQADAESDVKGRFTDATVTAVTCPTEEKVPVSDCYTGTDAPTDTTCVSNDQTNRCCLATYKGADDKDVNVCIKSGKGTNADATTAINALYPKGNLTPKCPAGVSAPADGDCTVTDKDLSANACFHSLDTTKGKCCLNTKDNKKTCVASGLPRTTAADAAKNAIVNKYDTGLGVVECAAETKALDKNTCGKGAADLKTTDTEPKDKTECSKDKNVCCLATSIDGKKKRCIGNDKVPDAKGVNRTNAAGPISELYGDISAIDCSSKFVSASVAIVAIVLALF